MLAPAAERRVSIVDKRGWRCASDANPEQTPTRTFGSDALTGKSSLHNPRVSLPCRCGRVSHVPPTTLDLGAFEARTLRRSRLRSWQFQGVSTTPTPHLPAQPCSLEAGGGPKAEASAGGVGQQDRPATRSKGGIGTELVGFAPAASASPPPRRPKAGSWGNTTGPAKKTKQKLVTDGITAKRNRRLAVLRRRNAGRNRRNDCAVSASAESNTKRHSKHARFRTRPPELPENRVRDSRWGSSRFTRGAWPRSSEARVAVDFGTVPGPTPITAQTHSHYAETPLSRDRRGPSQRDRHNSPHTPCSLAARLREGDKTQGAAWRPMDRRHVRPSWTTRGASVHRGPSWLTKRMGALRNRGVSSRRNGRGRRATRLRWLVAPRSLGRITRAAQRPPRPVASSSAR